MSGNASENQTDNFITTVVIPPKEQLVEVKYWWDEVTGADIALSSDYLLDTSAPWTRTAWTHVLAPDDPVMDKGNVNQPSIKPYLDPDEKSSILTAISTTFFALSPPAWLRQPLVHFSGRNVHISGLDQVLLEAFWKTPPTFKGKPMKFVSKGAPFDDLFVFDVHGVAAMNRDELLRAVQKQHSSLKIVLASVYQANEIPGRPSFCGDLVVFASANIVGYEFLGRKYEPRVYAAGAGK